MRRRFSGAFLARLAVGLSLIYLMLIPPGIIVSDAISMFSVSKSIATEQTFAVPCHVSGYPELPVPDRSTVTGRGGKCYSYFYPLISFVAVPLVAAGEGIGDLAGVRGDNAAQVLALVIPALAAAAAALLTAALALELGASRRGAVLAAVAFGFGTEALTHARTFFAETLGAFLVALAVWGMLGEGRRKHAGLAAIGLAVLAKPQLILVGPAIGLALAIHDRRPGRLVGPVAATLAGGAAYLVYNWARFADATNFGGTPTFSPRAYVSALGLENLGILLVSPGRGLLFFSPVAILGAVVLWRRRSERAAWVCGAAALAVLVLYIGHSDPYIGRHWGGKYLVPLLPLACAPVGALRGRLRTLAAVLIVVGLVSQIPTTVAFYDRTFSEHAAKGVHLAQHPWSLAKSPLVGAWPAMLRQLDDARRADVRELADEASADRPQSLGETGLQKVVALWWWLLPVIGIPWWLGAVAAAVVTSLGAAMVLRSPRAPPRDAGDGAPESDLESVACPRPARRRSKRRRDEPTSR